VFPSLFTIRGLPDTVAFFLVASAQTIFAWGLQRRYPGRSKSAITAAWAISMVVLTLGVVLRSTRMARHFPLWMSSWGRGAAIAWAFMSVLMIGCYELSRLIARPRADHDPARREVLRAFRWALLGAPVAAVGYGTFVQRFRLRLREQDIPIPGLPADLNGLRIAQLTDIHLSPFLSVRELERAVAMANETRPHLTLVTGDLITSGADPLDDCLRTLAFLKSDAGVFGCMGNHEVYADTESYTEREAARLGMTFLRQRSKTLRFGTSDLNLAGVDYQRFKKPYLKGAEKLIVPGAFNVLMSHNPDVFPVAAAKGFPLTVAGHTHGGQVKVEILRQDLNVARLFTPYVDGLYQKGASSMFVSRGIGTIGLPARLGAPPEVALLKLCRT